MLKRNNFQWMVTRGKLVSSILLPVAFVLLFFRFSLFSNFENNDLFFVTILMVIVGVFFSITNIFLMIRAITRYPEYASKPSIIISPFYSKENILGLISVIITFLSILIIGLTFNKIIEVGSIGAIIVSLFVPLNYFSLYFWINSLPD